MSRTSWWESPRRGTVAWLERNGYTRIRGYEQLAIDILKYGALKSREAYTTESYWNEVSQLWKSQQALLRALFGAVFRKGTRRYNESHDLWLPTHVYRSITFVRRTIWAFREKERAAWGAARDARLDYTMAEPPMYERDSAHAGVRAFALGEDFPRSLEAAWEVGGWPALKAVVDGPLHEPDPKADARFDPDAS